MNPETPPPLSPPASPPPPPALDPRPSSWQRALLLTMFGLGAVLVMVSPWLPRGTHLLVQRGGFFLAVYAALVATAWLPSSVLSRRVDALVERWVKSSTGGFYGVMALAVFLQLELLSAVRALATFAFDQDALREVLVQRLVGFSQESLMNFVWGMAWPARLMRDHGGHATGALVLACWLLCRATRRVLPDASLGTRLRAARAERT